MSGGVGRLAFDVLLCVLLVGVALGAVLVRELFAAVVFFVSFGLFVAIAWVRLGAIDVALAEAALGAGLTGVLLMRAAARLRGAPPPGAGDAGDAGAAMAQPPEATRASAQGFSGAPGATVGRHASPTRRAGARRAHPVLSALLCAALFAALAQVVLTAPAGEALAPRVQAQIGATGVSNPVTAVLLNFRGYDTLLETVVLLAALLAAWSLCSDGAWPGRPGLPDHARPEGLMASFARVLPPAGLLVGIHLFWAGADAPGGAFQAGTILAAVWLLAAMAGLARPAAVESTRLRLVLVAGPALFLSVAVAAIPFGSFLYFPGGVAKALVLLVESGLTVSIAATLGLLVMGPPARQA
ncbi:hydrogen gas-evolving membrane-bound hydrogenase subunit E [Ramlibacter sp. AN1015]|uniref:hydrogen gas-evolving membrane-bound hydrogenase subunit E n=1 Tax=Ramlibacter sp. AN1015 TaxID=3133428 RepID=UPI0030BC285B